MSGRGRHPELSIIVCRRTRNLPDAALVLQADLRLVPGDDLGRRPGAPVALQGRCRGFPL